MGALESVDWAGVCALEHDLARIRGDAYQLEQRAQGRAGHGASATAPHPHGTPRGIG